MNVQKFDEWPHLLEVGPACDNVDVAVPRNVSTLFEEGEVSMIELCSESLKLFGLRFEVLLFKLFLVS